MRKSLSFLATLLMPLAFFGFTPPGWAQNVTPKIIVQDISLPELKQGLRDHSIILVDIRESRERAQGYVAGSLFNPLSSFDLKRLPQESGKRVVLICRSGRRTQQAIRLAQEAGRNDIHTHFGAGMLGWEAAGEPVAR